jgi:hypothetical protein
MSVTWGHTIDLDFANAHIRNRRQRRAVRTWLRDWFSWLRLPDFGDMQ